MRPETMAALDPASVRQATEAVASIPRGAEGPVFREPWEAQAFAMAVALHQRGLFAWSEWATTLADEIKRAQAAGDRHPARPITAIGSPHSNASSRRRACAMGPRSGAIATPGTTPPTAPRTARRSN